MGGKSRAHDPQLTTLKPPPTAYDPDHISRFLALTQPRPHSHPWPRSVTTFTTTRDSSFSTPLFSSSLPSPFSLPQQLPELPESDLELLLGPEAIADADLPSPVPSTASLQTAPAQPSLGGLAPPSPPRQAPSRSFVAGLGALAVVAAIAAVLMGQAPAAPLAQSSWPQESAGHAQPL